jgi:hypothetical protein
MKFIHSIAPAGLAEPCGMTMLSVQMTAPSSGTTNCRPSESPDLFDWNTSPDQPMVSATSPRASALM